MQLSAWLLVSVLAIGVAGCGPSDDASAAGGTTTATATPLDRAALERVMARTGSELAGGVLRFGMPRTDLAVEVDGVRLRPAFALGSWLAFTSTPHGALAMGDLVLRDTELAPVLSRLQEAGIEQSAIHHHVVRESPRVLYVHLHAHGDALRVAEGVRAALALTGTPPEAAPAPAAASVALDLDTALIATTLGRGGRANGGVYQIIVPRVESVREGNVEIPATMGLGTVINFQPTGNGRAAITGDFVLLAGEVNPVIRVLRSHGIEVTSLHNHLLNDEPRLFFMHFWANADAAQLSRGLRSALDSTNSMRGSR